MKIIKNTLIAFVFLLTLSFTLKDKEFQDNLLKVGETIAFSNKPKYINELTSVSMTKGAYDGSGYALTIDTGKNITLRSIKQSNGPKQDELLVIGCTGTMTRNKENVIFNFEKCRKKYYLIDMINAKLIDSFDSIVQLSLSSTDINGNPAEFYCSQKDKSAVYEETSIPNIVLPKVRNTPKNTDINLTSVPADMKKEDLFSKVHKENTLAHFSNIELLTSTNKKVNLPSGDYMICEGNSFSMR
jgi:hypothetical protein